MRKSIKRSGVEIDPVLRELQLMKKTGDLTNELLRDLLICQLGIIGIPQLTIREIVGVDIYHVNRIVKNFKKVKKANT
jgi:hypothetical protein